VSHEQVGAQATRVLAHAVLMRVLRDGAYADRALSHGLDRSGLDARNRGFVTDLVYGTLRHGLRLDYYLGCLVKRPLRKVPLPTLVALRLGAYQLLETRVPDHGAVGEAVELVRQHNPHQAGFANAILRELGRRRDAATLPDPAQEMRDPLEALAAQSAHPLWLVQLVEREIGEVETRAWVAANNEVAPLYLRVNPCRATRDDVAQRLREAGVQVELGPLPLSLSTRAGGAVTALPGFAEGHFTVQDAAAQLVGVLACPAAGSFVLDACAAPGGKATHLAELMCNHGQVLAVDVHPGKTRLIAAAAVRLGLASVVAGTADATSPEALRDLLRAHGRSDCDAVLVDAPCSGLGTVRRNPELRYRGPKIIEELCAMQDRLLETCAPLVRPGGHLTYAVCTITAAEGPLRVQAFLERHRDFGLDFPLGPELEPYRMPLGNGACLRTWPHRHGTDGFFAARLVRARSSS